MKSKPIDHIKDLIHDPKNARKHTPRNVGTIVSALQEVGAARSIVIDEDGVVLAGNATMDAAAEAGITAVKVVEANGNELVAVRRTGLTAEQKTRLALYDNRAAELAEWDEKVLQELAETGELNGIFSEQEIADLYDVNEPEPVEKLEQALQLIPGREYCVVMCEDETQWEEMKQVLGLSLVRRGGYKDGSAFDAVNTQRVIQWKDLAAKVAR